MTRTPLISWISHHSPKTKVFELIQNQKGNRWIWKKKLFWKLVPCIEVTLMSKFYSIWSTIPQESNLGRKGQILGENHVFQRPPTEQCPAPPDNAQRDPDKVRPSVLSSRNPQSDNVQLRLLARCSFTVLTISC
jgi:hypothetical protein